jgi:hypothetical protein
VLAAWGGLYAGRLVADDIRDLAREHLTRKTRPTTVLIGNHDVLDRGSSPDPDTSIVLSDALDATLKAMNGSGVFRSPNGRGVGADAYRNEVRGADAAVGRWRRETYAVLRRHLLPDLRSVAREPAPRSFTLPVLSPGDRRAALRSLWSPFLPDARWETEHTARAGSAHVYLDVSGSMCAEMPLIVACSAGWRRTSAGRSGRSVTSSRRRASSRDASSPTRRGAPAWGASWPTWRGPGRKPQSS